MGLVGNRACNSESVMQGQHCDSITLAMGQTKMLNFIYSVKIKFSLS